MNCCRIIPSQEISHTEKISSNIPSKWLITAGVVGLVAGVVLATLGILHFFGSTGYIPSIAGGVERFLVSCALMIMTMIRYLRNDKPVLEDRQKTAQLLSVLQHEDIQASLKQLPVDFFNNTSHERAKEVFSDAMKSVLDAKVYFPKTCRIEDPDVLEGKLDLEVFHVSQTQGVQHDIPRSSQDSEHLHVYQIASQCNGSEAPHIFTPAVGEAMQTSENDRTQGPLAQRTNPAAFELANAFLANLGFNMLEQVIPESIKQQPAVLQHGYLCPTNSNIESLTQEFIKNYAKTEYVCYESHPNEWQGVHPVHIFLQAAPAIGYSQDLDRMQSNDLQKYAALANYLALFQYGIDLAKRTGQRIVLHAAAVGGGVFANTTPNLMWGFEKAALHFQQAMKENHVFVQLEYFGSNPQKTSPMLDIGTKLGILNKERLGD